MNHSTAVGVRPARRTLVMLVIALLIAAGATAFVGTTSAQALCASTPMLGSWHNIDPNTRALTRVNVGLVCGDVRQCDENGHCTGGDTYVTMRPFGKCSPSDCDWGVRRATSMGDGWERAVYTYSWSTKYVWLKTYSFYGRTYLRVYTSTDFTAADGRTDYTTDEWMLK
ncbi:MAG: hypothetical protein L0H25_08715 [Micrococcales bacterium]|nr:hypothetical protein [Micrococcales bacterium]